MTFGEAGKFKTDKMAGFDKASNDRRVAIRENANAQILLADMKLKEKQAEEARKASDDAMKNMKREVDDGVKLGKDSAKARLDALNLAKEYSTGYYQFRVEQIDALAQTLRNAGLNEVEIGAWRDNQIKQATIEKNEFIIENTTSMIEGLVAAWENYALSIKSTIQLMVDFVDASYNAMKASSSDFFYTALTTQVLDFKSFFTSFIQSITRAWSDMLSQMVVDWTRAQVAMGVKKLIIGSLFNLAGNMTPGSYAAVSAAGVQAQGLHGGGIVGQNASFTRTLPSSYFSNAPRFHKGLMSDEIPAILQKGERVIPRGKKTANVNGSGGSGETQVNYNIVIQAADAKSFSDMTKRNPQAIIGPIISAINNNDSSMRGAIATAIGR
jgi:hypothetical protein